MLHTKVRELLVNFVRNNANKFRVYVADGSLEDHLLNMQYRQTLYAAASLFDKEIQLYQFHSGQPGIRVDRKYTWIRIPPYPPQVELVFPPKDEH